MSANTYSFLCSYISSAFTCTDVHQPAIFVTDADGNLVSATCFDRYLDAASVAAWLAKEFAKSPQECAPQDWAVPESYPHAFALTGDEAAELHEIALDVGTVLARGGSDGYSVMTPDELANYNRDQDFYNFVAAFLLELYCDDETQACDFCRRFLDSRRYD